MVEITYQITCDKCKATARSVAGEVLLWSFMRRAHKGWPGWKRVDAQDWCPACMKAHKQKQKTKTKG